MLAIAESIVRYCPLAGLAQQIPTSARLEVEGQNGQVTCVGVIKLDNHMHHTYAIST